MSDDWADEVAEAPPTELAPVLPELPQIMLFGKWSCEDVSVSDMSLQDYIAVKEKYARYMPHSAGRFAAKRFRKAQCPIVERLCNSLMMHGRNNGKKLMTVRIVKHAFEIIHLLTGENPLQVVVNAIINSGPREDSTRIGRAGTVRRQAVDVSPLRRVNQAIWLLCTGAREAAFRNIKSIAECLSDELINAAKGSSNSYAIKKKDELESVASLVDLSVELFFRGDNFLYLMDSDQKKPIPSVSLSPLLSQKIFLKCKEHENVDEMLNFFSNSQQTPLNGYIDLSCSPVSKIDPLWSQPAKFVNCEYSRNLRIDHVLETFRTSRSNLVYLNVDSLMVDNPYLKGEEDLPHRPEDDPHPFFDIDCWLGRFTQLESLIVANTNLSFSYLTREVISYLSNLTHLDLGGLVATDGLHVLLPLRNTLKSLSLYNLEPSNGPILEQRFKTICSLKKLQFLDISFSNNDGMAISYGIDNLLLELIGSLPELSSLDISGTTLAEESTNRDLLQVYLRQRPQTVDSVIPALQILQAPLEFLGLLNTSMAVRSPIPAKVVTGNANEKQLLENFKRYRRRKPFVLETFHSVYQLLRDRVIKKPVEFLSHVIDCMDLYLDAIEIQVSGSASLYHISADDSYKNQLNTFHKRAIIQQCLRSMQKHKNHDGMQRNGCLVMFNFEIPDNFEFVYDELVLQTLHTIQTMSTAVSRIAIHLLNAMMGHAERQYKCRAPRLNVIQVLVEAIRKRVDEARHDELIDHAWSSLWNLTDETEVNCARFIELGGIEMFLKCHELFRDYQDMIRNMLGCLGNVAEVRTLRRNLLTTDCLNVFSELLRPPRMEDEAAGPLSNGELEISYNACGILAHILSDGADIWRITTPTRDQIKNDMEAAILTWNFRGERNINYRSFLPILRLLEPSKSTAMEPESQHWAVWALFNLCTVYPEKYVSMLIGENGLEILKFVFHNAQQGSELYKHCGLLLEILENFHGENSFN